MILMLDNYDSFTYNLVQYFGEMGEELKVFRNDRITIPEIAALAPDRIVISPGPGTPERAGISVELIRHFAPKLPILGVCLGHQAIGVAFGGEVVRALAPMHGKTSLIDHDRRGVFTGLPNPLEATRYHSLVIKADTMPSCLEISARSGDGEVMGVRHKQFAVEGVQFHPESVLTACGKELLRNFLSIGAGRLTGEEGAR